MAILGTGWPSPGAEVSAFHRSCQGFQDPLAAPVLSPGRRPVRQGCGRPNHLGSPCGTRPLTTPAPGSDRRLSGEAHQVRRHQPQPRSHHDTDAGHPSPDQTRPCPIENTVNGSLTPKRRRPITENPEYAAFARRILRAYSRRIAAGDVESLTHLISPSDDIDNAIQQAVSGLRASGYSWTEIGARLGITRQAAQQRWGHP